MLRELLVNTSILCKSIPNFLLLFVLTCIVLILRANTVYSQTQNKVVTAPLYIISDKMVAQKDASVVEFIGNVKATIEDSIIFADSIKIYVAGDSTDKSSSARSNVKKIIATGNVRYTAGKQKAFADKAVFTTHDEILVLTGKSPKLITGSNFVTGKKITLLRNQDKVIVESDGTQRVEAFFNPEDSDTDK
jgi:lipopolysaccharide export system protein LptA